MKNILALGELDNVKIQNRELTHPHFRMFSYIFIIATRIAAVPLAKAIRVMIMLRISGVLPILLIRRSRDITVNWIRSIDSPLINEVSWFSTAYKKAGSITQAIAITNRLPPRFFSLVHHGNHEKIRSYDQRRTDDKKRISYSFMIPHIL